MRTIFSSYRPAVLIVLGLFALLHLFIVVLDHYYFRTVALDYAIYNFAFYDFAHFRVSPVPAYIFPFPATFLQDHFSLTLVFLSPLYWLFKPLLGTYTLLIIQWMFIVIGGVASYKLIQYKSGNWKLALLALVYYFVLFGRYSAYRADVNLAIIGSSMIPLFLYLFEKGKRIPAALCFVFLLLNREDYALWFVFIFLWLMIEHWKDKQKRNWAIYGMFISILFFVTVFKFIIPLFEDENKKYALFDFTAVGETPVQALGFILNHPLKAIELLFINHSGEPYHNNIKANFWLVYLVSGGVLLLFRPWYLIPFIPILAKKMYDDNPLRWSIETYYSVEFVSILPALVFLIILRFKRGDAQLICASLVCLVSFVTTAYKLAVPPPNPIVGESNKYNFMSAAFYKPDRNVRDIRELLSMIPQDAPVTAGCRLLPHLAYRDKVYYFPKLSDAQYVIVLKEGDAYPLFQKDFDAEVQKLRESREWSLVSEKPEVILFKKRPPGPEIQ